jgi:glucose-1-phosphate thymidylyltransferase
VEESSDIQRAVILAGGLGTRMRAAGQSPLQPEQSEIAAQGIKGLIPLTRGRVLLDYTLSALADAGYREVCLVVGASGQPVRDHYEGMEIKRLSLYFAVQPEPRGTADALLAAEPFANGEEFVMINADNYYPAQALTALRSSSGPALAAFRVDALLSGGIPYARLAHYPVITWDQHNRMIELQQDSIPCATDFVSMNCWRFDARIFDHCRTVKPGTSGELELPAAVGDGLEQGMEFRVYPLAMPVLDLSTRGDVAGVAERLLGVQVSL